ncbi:putative RNA-dependent RNA polymerase 1 [Porphyridium purpureum]|uniref:RNA-dependent RNA polymerase n=1 Tax=Porphyridium purpureum TaxID=35688 RepID=A0A5J4YQP4_PORPP|nr:putative RNA-dependent RNA polymerase 1 [Porphyridium purpureum]|eukprot:POR5608..scf236_6
MTLPRVNAGGDVGGAGAGQDGDEEKRKQALKTRMEQLKESGREKRKRKNTHIPGGASSLDGATPWLTSSNGPGTSSNATPLGGGDAMLGDDTDEAGPDPAEALVKNMNDLSTTSNASKARGLDKPQGAMIQQYFSSINNCNRAPPMEMVTADRFGALRLCEPLPDSNHTSTDAVVTQKLVFEELACVCGKIDVKYHPQSGNLEVTYALPDFRYSWKIPKDLYRPGACYWRSNSDMLAQKGFELVLMLKRPPIVMFEGMMKPHRPPKAHPFGISGLQPTLEITHTPPVSMDGMIFRECRFALHEHSRPFENTLFAEMDALSISIQFAAASSTGVPQSVLLHEFSAKKCFAGSPQAYEVRRLVESPSGTNPQNAFHDELNRLPFHSRWMLYNCLTQNLMGPRAVTSDLVDCLLEVEPKLQYHALDLVMVKTREENLKLGPVSALRRLSAAIEATVRMQTLNLVTPKDEPAFGFNLIGNVEVSPSMFFCRGPVADQSNRMLRKYKEHATDFIRVSFVSEDLEMLHVNSGTDQLAIRRVRRCLFDGLEIFGRKYQFLMYSQSMLKNCSCWFLDCKSTLNVEEVRRWMGDDSNIGHPGKQAARLGLCLSATFPSINLDRSEYLLEDDKLSDNGSYEMTNGCGLISPAAAHDIWRVLVEQKVMTKQSYCPSAFQIRYGGYKGMLVVSDRVPLGKKVVFRKSMRKISADERVLEICEWSRFRPAFLNRQIVIEINALGVSDATLEKKQQQYVEDIVRIVDQPACAINLLWSGGTGAVRDWELCLAMLLHVGFPLDSDRFLYQTLFDIVRWNLQLIRKKNRIHVRDGTLLFGVADPTETLVGDEVLVQYRTLRSGSQTEYEDHVLEGAVTVTRNPCMYPGDVRVLRAVRPSNDALAALKDVIVFPVIGSYPCAKMMGNGDMDGDLFSIYFDRDLIPTNGADPLMYEKQDPMEPPDWTEDGYQHFFIEHMLHNTIGQISNAAIVHADKNGAWSQECMILANMANNALNYQKSGIRVQLPDTLRVKVYPDFMEKFDRPAYRSEKVCGKLYRKIVDYHNAFERRIQDPVPFQRNRMLLWDGYEEYILQANKIKHMYDIDLEQLMNQYGVRSESQFFSGCLGNQEDRHFVNKDWNELERISTALEVLKKKYRDIFLKGLGERAESREEQMKKASAWYWVSYRGDGTSCPGGRQVRLYSFAWLHAVLLSEVYLQKRTASSMELG